MPKAPGKNTIMQSVNVPGEIDKKKKKEIPKMTNVPIAPGKNLTREFMGIYLQKTRITIIRQH